MTNEEYDQMKKDPHVVLMYDISQDNFRPVTQADWDLYANAAQVYGALLQAQVIMLDVCKEYSKSGTNIEGCVGLLRKTLKRITRE